MFNNYKKLEKLEEKISELEEQIPSEREIREFIIGEIDVEKRELERLYEERAKVRQEAWDFMKENIDTYAAEYMEELIKKSVKDIEDKLIVELARKAMNMEVKNE